MSKAILPWFGGTAAVWTTCMLFFQSILFCGYAYAHFSDRWLAKMQGLVHVGLIVVALLLLRVLPSDAWKPQDSSYPAFRILGLLAISVGLPYFALSSTGPLLQARFARVSRQSALSALRTFEFRITVGAVELSVLVRTTIDIPDQAKYWSWGFVAYAVLCGYAAISVWLSAQSCRWQRRCRAAGVRSQGAGARSRLLV